MAIAIESIPAISFSRNFPDLIIEAPDETGVVVTLMNDNATTFLSEKFYNNPDGNFVLRLKDILDRILSVEVPTNNLYTQASAVGNFYITIYQEEVSLAQYEFSAIKGGIASDEPAADFLLSHFLTWKPQIIETKEGDTQYLSYYAAMGSDCRMMLKGYGETIQIVDGGALTQGNLYTINTSWNRIFRLFTNNPQVIDVWIVDDDIVRTYVQRYVRTEKYDEFDDQFMFLNSVGGIDVIRFNGELKQVDDHTISSALFDEETIDYELLFNRYFSKSTGHLADRAARIWALEFMASKIRFHQNDDTWKRISIKKQDVSGVAARLNDFAFEFCYSVQNELQNIARIVLPDPEDIEPPVIIEEMTQDSNIYLMTITDSDFSAHTNNSTFARLIAYDIDINFKILVYESNQESAAYTRHDSLNSYLKPLTRTPEHYSDAYYGLNRRMIFVVYVERSTNYDHSGDIRMFNTSYALLRNNGSSLNNESYAMTKKPKYTLYQTFSEYPGNGLLLALMQNMRSYYNIYDLNNELLKAIICPNNKSKFNLASPNFNGAKKLERVTHVYSANGVNIIELPNDITNQFIYKGHKWLYSGMVIGDRIAEYFHETSNCLLVVYQCEYGNDILTFWELKPYYADAFKIHTPMILDENIVPYIIIHGNKNRVQLIKPNTFERINNIMKVSFLNLEVPFRRIRDNYKFRAEILLLNVEEKKIIGRYGMIENQNSLSRKRTLMPILRKRK